MLGETRVPVLVVVDYAESRAAQLAAPPSPSRGLPGRALVGGRGAAVEGEDAMRTAVAQNWHLLDELYWTVGDVHARSGTPRKAFQVAHAALAPDKVC